MGARGQAFASVLAKGLSGFSALRRAALLEAIALAVHLEDVDVVGETVQEGTGEARRAEHLGPLVERQVGGDQGRIITAGDRPGFDLKEMSSDTVIDDG